jgi:hypothetical protein
MRKHLAETPTIIEYPAYEACREKMVDCSAYPELS